MAFAVAQKAALRAVPTARRSVAVAGRPARSLVIRAAGEPKVLTSVDVQLASGQQGIPSRDRRDGSLGLSVLHAACPTGVT
jgi:hypothetical protein